MDQALLPINSGFQSKQSGGTGITGQSLISPSPSYSMGVQPQPLQKPSYMSATSSQEVPAAPAFGLPQNKIGLQDGTPARSALSAKNRESDEFFKDSLQTIQTALGRYMDARQQGAVNDYNVDVTNWKEEGKYWFDPTSELRPDLNRYMEKMPSAVDALKNSSTFMGNEFNTKRPGPGVAEGMLNPISDWTINPASFRSNNKAVQYALNPISIADRRMGEGFSAHVGSKAAEGALKTGVGPQMIVGALVGVIEGIFGWKSAKAKDAKAKAAALEKYERELKEWEIHQERQIRESRIASERGLASRRLSFAAAGKAEKETKDSASTMAILQRRKQMMEALQSAGSTTEAYRKKRRS